MPVWAVTGGSGFLGGHLLARLEADAPPGVRVVAVGRTCPAGWSVESFVEADLAEPGLRQLEVEGLDLSVIFHLAGRTPPAVASELYRSNILGTLHLLDRLRAANRAIRVVMVGSAAELGPVPTEMLPVGEDHPCRPAGSYGLSKLLATTAGLAALPPLEVIVARVFNPIGPGAPATQAFGRFAKELASGVGPARLSVVGIEDRRDFVDARDVAEALVTLASSGRPGGVYNVGTGRSHAVREGLDRLIRLSGREVEVEIRPGLAGSNGPSDSRADVRRIAEETGWTARILWEDSLRDLWDHAKAGRGSG